MRWTITFHCGRDLMVPLVLHQTCFILYAFFFKPTCTWLLSIFEFVTLNLSLDNQVCSPMSGVNAFQTFWRTTALSLGRPVSQMVFQFRGTPPLCFILGIVPVHSLDSRPLALWILISSHCIENSFLSTGEFLIHMNHWFQKKDKILLLKGVWNQVGRSLLIFEAHLLPSVEMFFKLLLPQEWGFGRAGIPSDKMMEDKLETSQREFHWHHRTLKSYLVWVAYDSTPW